MPCGGSGKAKLRLASRLVIITRDAGHSRRENKPWDLLRNLLAQNPAP